jgi:mycothiol synthase
MPVAEPDHLVRVSVHHHLPDDERAEILALLHGVHVATGRRPLNDHLRLDLLHGGRRGFAAVLGRVDGLLVGYAQVSEGHEAWALDVVTSSECRPSTRAAVADATLDAAIAAIRHQGGGPVHWWVTDPDDATDHRATAAGLRRGRTLHQMCVDLPVPSSTPVETRPFRVGVDEPAWLDVNNAAFDGHPEQGGWDLATLEQRQAEAWFDPAGFLVHERDGRMAGFCWTKLHHDDDPVMGEIYVVAVHPDFHGLGLGRALTEAGLASIAARGIGVGMLHVDGDNTAAFGLYRSMGFTIHHTDQAFVGEVGDGSGPMATTRAPAGPVETHDPRDTREPRDTNEPVGVDHPDARLTAPEGTT